jgi:hypothetical protein
VNERPRSRATLRLMQRFLVMVGVLGVASSALANTYPTATVGAVKGKLQLAFRITATAEDAARIRAWHKARTIPDAEDPDATRVVYRGKNLSCEDISLDEGSGPEFECETVFDENGKAAVPKKLLVESEVPRFPFVDGTASVSGSNITIERSAGTLLYFWVPQNPVLICTVDNGTAGQVQASCTFVLDFEDGKVLPNAE